MNKKFVCVLYYPDYPVAQAPDAVFGDTLEEAVTKAGEAGRPEIWAAWVLELSIPEAKYRMSAMGVGKHEFWRRE